VSDAAFGTAPRSPAVLRRRDPTGTAARWGFRLREAHGPRVASPHVLLDDPGPGGQPRAGIVPRCGHGGWRHLGSLVPRHRADPSTARVRPGSVGGMAADLSVRAGRRIASARPR